MWAWMASAHFVCAGVCTFVAVCESTHTPLGSVVGGDAASPGVDVRPRVPRGRRVPEVDRNGPLRVPAGLASEARIPSLILQT